VAFAGERGAEFPGCMQCRFNSGAIEKTLFMPSQLSGDLQKNFFVTPQLSGDQQKNFFVTPQLSSGA
jgi:hypothetical protein